MQNHQEVTQLIILCKKNCSSLNHFLNPPLLLEFNQTSKNYLKSQEFTLKFSFSILFLFYFQHECSADRNMCLQAEQNMIYFSTNQPVCSVHQYMSLHVQAFSAWCITLLLGLFESESFKFMPYRFLKCLGTCPLLFPKV